MTDKPEIKLNTESLLITFPISITTINYASILLYRPSQAGLDKKYQIDLSQGRTLNIPTKELKKGLWKYKLQWSDGDKEYYTEESIAL